MGFLVIQVRRQNAGTQDGFDVSVLFFDNSDREREVFIECKYYTSSQLEWSDIFNKQFQLNGSNHVATAFILISPLRNLSNIDHDLQKKAVKLFKCPVEFLTPDKEIEKLCALDHAFYKKVFNKRKCEVEMDEAEELNKFRVKINSLIQKRDMLEYANVVEIVDTDKIPNEDGNLRTNLDDKLNSLATNDATRIEYHKLRANYKVYLDGLQDLNSELRKDIMSWESNLRLKADRLTKKFQMDSTYTPFNFFNDFFDEAEKEILTFYKDFELKGDKEKLLHGVVFELAAQCPLDWRKNGTD